MRRRFTHILLYFLALTTLAGVGGLLWHLREQRILFYSDADSIRRPVDETLTRDVLWTPPVEVDGAVNSALDEYGPRVTHDGLVMYLVRQRADDPMGRHTDILISTRGTDGWGDPVPFEAINTPADELGPEPSRDGRSLYFASNRAGGAGGYDLWVVHRDDTREDGWATPVNLGAGVNTPYHEYGPAVTATGDTIWFASNRPGAGEEEMPGADESVTVREDLYRGDFDLYSAAIADGTPTTAQPALKLNSVHHDSAPALSPTGDFLYFSSDRDSGLGGFDIYRVRLTPEIGTPSNLGAPVNSGADEIDPGVSIAGFGLHFSSDRSSSPIVAPDGTAPDEEPVAVADADHELYFAASREVYTATEVFRASIDWLAILPYALWIVIAILLMTLVWSLGRALSSERYRALNLIAKCLIASLFVHALLLVGLAFWGVGNSVSEWAARRGTLVAIVSPSVGSELAAQIRGTMTDVAMDAQVVAAEQKESAVAPPQGEPAPTELTVAQTSIDASEPAPATAANDAPAPTPALPDSVEPAEVQPLSGATLALEMETSPAPTASAETAIEIPTDVPGAEPVAYATPSTPVVPVVSNPAPSSAASLAGAETIVEDSVARDARPSARHAAPRSAARTTVVERIAGIVTDLPTVPEAAVQRTGEAEQVAASAASETPRARQSFRGPEASTRAARIDIVPVDGRTAPEETSLAAAAGAAAISRDALPTMSNPASGAAQARPPVLPAIGAASEIAFDLPAANADVAPPSVESVVVVDVSNATTPVARRATTVNPEAASTATVVFAEPDAATMNSALAAHLTSAVPAMLAVDAPPPIDLSPLEVRRLPVAPRRELELKVPVEEIVAPSPQRQRAPEARMKIVKEMGGNEETERAVAMSLDWLARHQSPDGRWDSDGYDDNCHACSGATRIEVDIAVTSLSMLCFLATDNTHLKPGPYQDTMARALHWLRRQQGADGNLLGTESMYSHGVATIALSEAYGMTGDPALQRPVESAVNFIVAARNRRGGGWRYAPGQAGDTSVLGWQIMAMKSAASAGVEVDPAGFASVRRWLDSIQRMAPPGLYIYQPGRPHSPAMTAEGLFVQQLLGSDPELVDMDASVEYILSNLPNWEQEANTYYWYYGTLALFQHQGDAWRRWNRHVKEQLLEHQVVSGRAAGSWDPADQWSRTGGRIYQTAICTLTLEVYYRYLPRFVQTANRK